MITPKITKGFTFQEVADLPMKSARDLCIMKWFLANCLYIF